MTNCNFDLKVCSPSTTEDDFKQTKPKCGLNGLIRHIMSIYGLTLLKNVRIILVPNQAPPYVTNILKAISDDKSLALFNSIAILGEDNNGCIPSIKEMNLTTKQYYSRIAGLMKADLIKKSKGSYSLTLLGKIVYNAHLNIGRALNNYWKLKALDSIQTSSIGQLPKEEFIRLADTLIDNHHIKNILFGPEVNNTIKKEDQPVISVES